MRNLPALEYRTLAIQHSSGENITGPPSWILYKVSQNCQLAVGVRIQNEEVCSSKTAVVAVQSRPCVPRAAVADDVTSCNTQRIHCSGRRCRVKAGQPNRLQIQCCCYNRHYIKGNSACVINADDVNTQLKNKRSSERFLNTSALVVDV